VLWFGLVVAAIPPSALAGSGGASDPSDAGKPSLGKVLRELQRLEADRTREDKQIRLMETERAQDGKEIKVLETEVKQVEGQNRKLQTANQQLQGQTQELQTKVASVPSSSQFARALEGYSGTHQFTLAGGAAGNFIYDRRTNTNTFALQVEPILLYHVNDWLAFEATIKASFSPGGPGTLGSGASFDMPVATAQIFLNDYMELVTGIFDQPFGDFYETQGPFWVNRMITAPLPYGSEALITPTDLGAQLRGGLQWGSLGQDVVFNGAVDKYGLSNPIPIKVGDLVRVFFVNAGPNLTSAFHVAGVLFSTVYRSGNPADALHGVNTLEVPTGDGAVFEFKVNQPGDYSFIDLNRAHQYKGAAGVFRATPCGAGGRFNFPTVIRKAVAREGIGSRRPCLT
jgi:hypothetical protein